MLIRTFAACALLLALLPSTASHAVEIRIRNDTGEDLRNVVVQYRNFGNLAKGQTTAYQTWDRATEVTNVSVRAASGVMGFRPKNPHLLETLGDGRFTYVLSLSDGRLTMRAEKNAE